MVAFVSYGSHESETVRLLALDDKNRPRLANLQPYRREQSYQTSMLGMLSEPFFQEELMFRKKVQRAAVLITAALVLSGCNWTQLNRWQQQTGIDLSVEDERELLALPDYMPDSCVQVVTGLRARGLTEEGLVKAERYGKRESRCCPNVVGGDTVGATCDVIGRVKGMDKTDTGLFQFNGYFPGGGVKDGTPAKRFCTEGVRRFRDGAWTDEFTHPCNQWEVLADPELQKDMMYDLVLHCGFGSWEPIRQSSGKMTYPCKNGLVWIATPEPFMNPAA